MLTVSPGGFESIGSSGSGTFFHSLGANNVPASSSGGGILIGNGPGSTGNYIQSGGTITVGDASDATDQTVFCVGCSNGATGFFTQNGGLNTIAGSGLSVGSNGTGVFTQSSGTNMVSSSFGTTVGSSGNGTYNLTGGSLRTSGSGGLTIASSFGSRGTFNQSGGINSVTGGNSLNVGGFSTAFGTYNLSGTGSLSVTENEVIAFAGTGIFNQSGGTNTVSGGIDVAAAIGSHGEYNLSGGVVKASDMFIAAIGVFNDGDGTLSVSGTGDLNLTGTLAINGKPGTAAYFSGGTISTGNLNVNASSANFHWTGGSLAITGANGLVIGSFGPLGSIALNQAKSLSVTNTVTVDAGYYLAVDGGIFTSGLLTNSGNVAFSSGTFNIAAGLSNSASGVFSIAQNCLASVGGPLPNLGEITLGGGAATLAGAGTLTNTGRIRGDGTISLIVANKSGGQILAESGKRLLLTAAIGTNLGQINLQGGSAVFSQPFTNGSTGLITGRGTLDVGSTGLLNQGNVAFSAGITDVFGKLNNNAGSSGSGIAIAGNVNVTFWSDVTNTFGLFKVNPGSFATFFGTFSGAGITGGGGLDFEADINPGFSPASDTFTGNVNFGAASKLKIELGGVSAGTEFDQVHVTGQLALDGALSVSTINGFKPQAGQSFDILDWGTLIGTFGSLVLPTLEPGLAWNTSQLYTTGVLSVATAAGIPGDFNHNGVVDAADYVAWRTDSEPPSQRPTSASGAHTSVKPLPAALPSQSQASITHSQFPSQAQLCFSYPRYWLGSFPAIHNRPTHNAGIDSR